MKTVTRHLRIEGHVQHVGFRWSLMEKAKALGLAGWVRNRHDSSVEAEISGPIEAVDALTLWAHRGPTQARVDRVRFQDAPYTALPDNDDISPDPAFTWRPTA